MPESDSLADIIRRANNNNYEELTEYFQKPFDANMAGQLDYIMNDPRKTNQEIKELLENIRPDADLPPEDREGTPDGLVYPLVSTKSLNLLVILTLSAVRTPETCFDVAKVNGGGYQQRWYFS
jgi:hypothetical protein